MKLLSIFSPERRWVLIFALVVMFLTTLPYIVGFVMQGDDWRFTGFVFAVEDGNAFIGKMLSGASGEFLFRTPYTAYPQRGFLIFIPYILLGKLVSPTDAHIQLVKLYHLFRVFAGLFAIIMTYEFLSYFISNVKYRRFGLVIAILGGGLGWLLFLLNFQGISGSLPLEFYSPESFGFLSLYVYPHYALARGLLLLTLLMYLKANNRIDEENSIFLEGIKIGVVWLLTSIAQPITGMIAGVILLIYLTTLLVWQGWLAFKNYKSNMFRVWVYVRLAMWASLVPAPFLIYNIVSSVTDPFLKVWTKQSFFGSPNLIYYILAYGLIIPFAIIGGMLLWHSDNWSNKLPVAWGIFLPILAYAPIGVQRRLPEGIWIAFIVMAMKALELGGTKTIRKLEVFLLFALPSTILLLSGGILFAFHKSEPIYRLTSEVEAFEALSTQPNRSQVVLSSYETGNALPAWAPVFVVIGHGPESVGLAELIPQVETFFQNSTTDEERIEFLRDLDVNYVFWGPKERSIGNWDPRVAKYLKLIYQKDEYYIFRVKL